jgi:hypothetical protein
MCVGYADAQKVPAGSIVQAASSGQDLPDGLPTLLIAQSMPVFVPLCYFWSADKEGISVRLRPKRPHYAGNCPSRGNNLYKMPL